MEGQTKAFDCVLISSVQITWFRPNRTINLESTDKSVFIPLSTAIARIPSKTKIVMDAGQKCLKCGQILFCAS